MNAELLPLIRKFHDRAFRGWMRVDERRADAKRQLEALGMRVIENTAANRQRLAAKYVKAAQRGGSPQEFYPDQSGAWLVVETDPLIWNPFAEALGSRLAWSSADGKIEVRGPVFDPDQADEPRNDVDELLAAVFPTQSSYVVTAGDLDDNEITWYDDGPTGNDDLASRAAAYGTEWQGWEYKQQWNPKTKSFTERREPRFEVGSPSAWLDRDGKTVSTVTTEEEIIGRMQGKYPRLAWSDEQGCMSLTPAPWVHPRTAVPWMDPEVTADWLDDPDASAVVDWLLDWLGEGEEWVGEWVAEEGITLTQIPRI
jgi:hypothetical protein